jgi:hypothetical protein
MCILFIETNIILSLATYIVKRIIHFVVCYYLPPVNLEAFTLIPGPIVELIATLRT